MVELPVGVGPAPGLGAGTWALLAVVAGLAALALYGLALRARFGRPGEAHLNLLDVPWVRRLLASRALQPALQVPLLALMALVVVVGFADVQDGGKNLATKLTWTIWWAGIIFTFFLVGRAWCLACPFGALNEWASRLAAPARRLPAPFRNIWWATGHVRAPDLGRRAARRGAVAVGDRGDRPDLRRPRRSASGSSTSGGASAATSARSAA